MLVHSANGRPIFNAHMLAERIVLCAFGSLPDPEISDVPFIQLLTREDGTKEFFCYENQFVIEFREFPDRYEFLPSWHCYTKEAIKREKAIATLHDHCFIQQGPAIGY